MYYLVPNYLYKNIDKNKSFIQQDFIILLLHIAHLQLLLLLI